MDIDLLEDLEQTHQQLEYKLQSKVFEFGFYEKLNNHKPRPLVFGRRGFFLSYHQRFVVTEPNHLCGRGDINNI